MMEKLKKLEALAAKADAVAAVMDGVNPHDILAIVDYVRELEQRTEAAEARVAEVEEEFSFIMGQNDELASRLANEEAKLAELEEQEAIFQVEVSGNHWLNAGPVEDSDFTGLPDGINLLYARPAPAIKISKEGVIHVI